MFSKAVEKKKQTLSWCQQNILSGNHGCQDPSQEFGTQKPRRRRSCSQHCFINKKNVINKFRALKRCGVPNKLAHPVIESQQMFILRVFHIAADQVLLAHHDCYLYWKASKPLICVRSDVTFCVLVNSSWLLQKSRQCFIGTTAISFFNPLKQQLWGCTYTEVRTVNSYSIIYRFVITSFTSLQ